MFLVHYAGYEDYETARKYSKRAKDTSNIESEEDMKRKKPARFYNSGHNATDAKQIKRVRHEIEQCCF